MSDHGLYPSPNNFDPYTDREVRLTKAIEAVMRVDLIGSVTGEAAKFANGYNEAIRQVRAAIENALNP